MFKKLIKKAAILTILLLPGIAFANCAHVTIKLNNQTAYDGFKESDSGGNGEFLQRFEHGDRGLKIGKDHSSTGCNFATTTKGYVGYIIGHDYQPNFETPVGYPDAAIWIHYQFTRGKDGNYSCFVDGKDLPVGLKIHADETSRDKEHFDCTITLS